MIFIDTFFFLFGIFYTTIRLDTSERFQERSRDPGCTWGKFRTSTGRWFYGRRTVRYPSRLWLDLSRR